MKSPLGTEFLPFEGCAARRGGARSDPPGSRPRSRCRSGRRVSAGVGTAPARGRRSSGGSARGARPRVHGPWVRSDPSPGILPVLLNPADTRGCRVRLPSPVPVARGCCRGRAGAGVSSGDAVLRVQPLPVPQLPHAACLFGGFLLRGVLQTLNRGVEQAGGALGDIGRELHHRCGMAAGIPGWARGAERDGCRRMR